MPCLFRDKLGTNIMKLFVGVRAKTWTYWMDDGSETKKPKEQKKA